MGNTPSSTPVTYRVQTLNILAEVFFSLADYATYVTDTSVLPYEARNLVLLAYLRRASIEVDILCLQEVEDRRVLDLQAAVGPAFYSAFVPHEPGHWSRYYDVAHPYIPNGNMIFIRKSIVSGFSPIFGAINCSTGANFVTASFTATNGYKIQVVCVHLDSDVGGNRKKELQTVIDTYTDIPHPLIICGDFNATNDISNLQQITKVAGLTDVMLSLGPEYDVPTHPFVDAYNKNKIYSRIDRCSVSRQFTILPSSEVLGVMAPADKKIEECFRQYGTDHYPVEFNLRL